MATLTKIPLYFIARVSLLILTCTIFFLTFYGRTLQNTFPILVASIPIVAAAALVLLLVAFLLVLRARSAQQTAKNWNLSVPPKSLIPVLVVLLFGVFVTESLISFPIERVHVLKFSLLAILAGLSQAKNSRSYRITAGALFAGLAGVIEESLQYWVPDRFFDWNDILLNVFGALLGGLFLWSLSRISPEKVVLSSVEPQTDSSPAGNREY